MRKVFAITSAVVLLGASGGGYLYFKRKSYEVVSPKKGEIVEAIYGLGKVKTNRRYELKIGVMASITNIYVTEGDVVKKDAPLVRFDTGVVFRAPFQGTITMINNFAGEVVQPQMPVLRLEDITEPFIEVSLEQEGALRVKKGQDAKIIFESLRNESLSGAVVALFPKDGEFIVQIKAENLPANVLPGMTADVAIEVGKIPDALLVPLKSIHNGMVVVRREGRQQKVKVDIGHVDGFWAEVKNDSINLGDEILQQKGAK